MHPSPQRRRTGWLDLRGQWRFAFDDADVGLRDGWPEHVEPFNLFIEVPFPPESKLSGIHDSTEHPVVWYSRTFRLSECGEYERGRRLLLNFGAVDYAAHVWLNGRLLGVHEGGHSSFTFDLTEALAEGDEQTLTLRAEDRPRDLTQPRGKQYWESEPAFIWYRRTTGIWQPVWLEAVGATYIADLSWTPDVSRGRLEFKVRLNAQPERPLSLRLRLSTAGGLLAEDTYQLHQQDFGRAINLAAGSFRAAGQRLLWEHSNPNLIDAEIVLLDADGSLLDGISSYVGLRSVQAEDGLYLLNGRPTYLRLVLAQNYWPESHLAAPSDEALRREVELIKSLGFNGVRIHQKVEDQRFLYWCDRLGLLVWAEMANAYDFSEIAVGRFTREWLEVVRQHYSHPSIITWVPFNESWGVPDLPGDSAQRDYVRAIYHLTKALDPTRPVIGNDGWEHLSSDVLSIHDYALDGRSLRERYGTPDAVEGTLRGRPQHQRTMLDAEPSGGRPVVLSEFGGITYEPQYGRPWFGYGSVDSDESFLHKYQELVDAVLDSSALAGFCYTQLTDTEQETNGLLRADRTPKLDPEIIRAINSRPSNAIPGDFIAAAQQAALTASGELDRVRATREAADGNADGDGPAADQLADERETF